MPVNVVHSAADEQLWARAKAAAKESSGKDGEPPWALVVRIFQGMKKKHAHAHAKKADDAPTLADGQRFQIGAADYDQSFRRGGEETKADRRLRNAKSEHRAARREYMKTPEGHAVHRQAQADYRDKNPSKIAAHHAARAEHGDGPSGHRCARCGKPAEHKHHPDYGDKTKVEWLCQEHHVKAHHPKSNLAEKSMNDLAKCSSGDNPKWYDKYRFTPLYVEALQIEKDWLEREPEVYSPPKSSGPSPWVKYDKARSKLEAKLLDHQIKQAKKDAKEAEKSMIETNDIFKSIMAGEILSKADLPVVSATDAALRAAYKAERQARAAVRKARQDIAYAELLVKAEKHGHDQKAIDEEAEEASEKAEASRAEADDAVQKAEAAKARVDPSDYAAYRKSRDSVAKALVNAEYGEAGLNSAQARDEGVRGGVTHGSTAEEPRKTSSMGMPSPERAREQIFSADDRPVDQQMDPGEGALERVIPGHSAANQVAETVRREAMSTRKSLLSGLGALGGGAQQDVLEARNDVAKSMSAAPEDIVFGLNPAAPGHPRGDGLVATYSNAEDERIMALVRKSEAAGHPGVFDEQSFTNRDTALVKSIKCSLCKSMVPAMFASCPSCGSDHGTGVVHGAAAGQTIVLEKSVADSLRGPTEDEWRFPSGNVRIPA